MGTRTPAAPARSAGALAVAIVVAATVALALALVVALAACTATGAGTRAPDGSAAPEASAAPDASAAPEASAAVDASGTPPIATPLPIVLPQPGAAPDYQLGGAYVPDDRVGIVVRDRGAEPAEPAEDRYSLCYINAFQTQPGERDAWPDDLVLRANGADIIDPGWPDEALLDTASAASRAAIAERVGAWIDDCADAGFAGVEFDNLDSFSRSHGALDADDNAALAVLLVARAHAAGLAAGQKNAAEEAAMLRARAGFDFAVAEECAAYRECGAYTAVYGERVIAIEYADNAPRPFAEVCADASTPASVVLRDRALAPAGEPGYVFALCP